MRLYTDKRVLIGFAVAVMVLLGLGYLSFLNNQRFIQTRQTVFHTTIVLTHIAQTQTNAIRTEEILAKYIISGDSIFLKEYERELLNAAEHYRNLKELTSDNNYQQVLLDSFRSIGTRKLETHRKIMEAVLTSRPEAERIINSKDNVASTVQVNNIIASMRNEENRLLNDRIERSKRNVDNFQTTFLLLMVATAIILIVIFYIINASFRARAIADERTQQINKELEAFTYSVSHDLRAPLRSIRGFAEVLKNEYGAKLDDEGNRLLGIVMKNASRMGQLIDDLLDFSRLGRKKLSYSRIQSNTMVTDVIKDLTQDDKDQVSWNIKQLEDMRADANMMRLVWTNLISNALKYSRGNGVRNIEIGSYPEDGSTVYYVKDNGVGFDMKYSDKLFKVFQRLHNNTEFEGTGVGLALVHRIIAKHNGKIWAKSKPRDGATFSFCLNNPTI